MKCQIDGGRTSGPFFVGFNAFIFRVSLNATCWKRALSGSPAACDLFGVTLYGPEEPLAKREIGQSEP